MQLEKYFQIIFILHSSYFDPFPIPSKLDFFSLAQQSTYLLYML